MNTPEPLAWLNGRLIPAREAALPVTDLGLQGIAVTETVRSFGHRLFRLETHLSRLFHSLAVVGFADPPERDELATAATAIVELNARSLPAAHDLGLVIFVTAGPNATYLGPATAGDARRSTACIHTFPLPLELWAERMTAGQHLVVSPVRQLAPESIGPSIKHRSRLHWHLADRAARQTDPAAAAIVLDGNGFLAETAAANVFVVSEGRIRTPKLGWILDGVSRRVVFELAAAAGIECLEENLSPDESAGADEMFLSSTPYCLMPVTRWNGRPVGDGRPGPVFRELMRRWNELAGLDIIAQICGTVFPNRP